MDDSQDITEVRGIGAFGMVPEWLLVADISSTAKVLFAWMCCKYANRSTWACWPGQQRLADDMNVSVGTIKHAINELVDVGALSKRQRVTTSNQPATNYYQMMFLPTVRKLTGGQKTDPAIGQKTVPARGQKTDYKPEVHEPEVLEREVQHPLIDSPLQYHKRHGGHVDGFCDWVCLPQEMATQFANRARMTDSQVRQWALQVRREWETTGKVATGSMWEFWNARWSERCEGQEDDRPWEGPFTRAFRLKAEREARAAALQGEHRDDE